MAPSSPNFCRARHSGAGALRGLESPVLGPGVAQPSGSGSLSPFPLPQVAEGGPVREPLQLLEVSPRKRLTAGPEHDPCGSRPAPEGAGPGAEQGHSAGGGGWCRHCHTKLAELKRQAWKLVSGPGTPLRVSDSSSAGPQGRAHAGTWETRVLEAGARLHRGFLANPLLPGFLSVTPLGGFILRGWQGLIRGAWGGRQWNPVCVWEGEGREGGGRASTLGGTAPALPAEEVTRRVVALGHLGPQPSVWKLHTWGGRAGRAGGGPPAEGPLAAPFPPHGRESCEGRILGRCHWRPSSSGCSPRLPSSCQGVCQGPGPC